MNINDRTSAFSQLGNFLKNYLKGNKLPGLEIFHQELDQIIASNFHYNGWFTEQSMKMALKGISTMLNEKDLREFSQQIIPVNEKKIAVIMAGNIPAVGFHDFLCVLLTGHKILIKASSDDHLLIPFFSKLLTHFNAGFTDKIEFACGKLSAMDAIIATGNDNSARYFEYYFAKYPRIIRKNRNSAAILDGTETHEELVLLGKDIFDYYGLGCRNVSKLFVPAGYDFNKFFEAIFKFKEVINHKKYGNNYEYHRAIFLLQGYKFLDNNFLILKEDPSLSSPVSVLHYEFYENEKLLELKISSINHQLQCLVGHKTAGLDMLSFGNSQAPGLNDFADKVNTIKFLINLG